MITSSEHYNNPLFQGMCQPLSRKKKSFAFNSAQNCVHQAGRSLVMKQGKNDLEFFKKSGTFKCQLRNVRMRA